VNHLPQGSAQMKKKHQHIVPRSSRHGICKLCEKDRVLQDSHLMGAALYRMSQDPTGKKGRDPVIMTPDIIIRTSKQVKDYVLCEYCEERFNKGGENWAMAHVDNGKTFPLLDRLRLALPLESGRLAQSFSACASGIDTEKLAYFVLSVIWRSSVHVWKLLGGQTTSTSLGAHQERVRKYLLGENGFPSDMIVMATVCTDFASRNFFSVPALVLENEIPKYSFMTRGLLSYVFVGTDMPSSLRKLCCVTSPQKPIFMADCLSKVLHASSRLYSTAKLAPNVRSL
jgi:hypothetical protein